MMTKPTCIIGEDNPIELDNLNVYLELINQLEVVATCTDGKQTWDALQRLNPDILLTDIDMPGLSGIDIVKGLKQPPVVIFITSHTEYAIESYEIDAVDFLVKPVTFERLSKAIRKAIEYLNHKELVALTTAPTMSEKEALPTDRFFFVKTVNDYTKIFYDDIVYIESMGAYSKIVIGSEAKQIITLVNLKNMEQQLPSNVFVRIHKQYIINYKQLKVITQSDVGMTNGINLPVGLAYRAQLLQKMEDKLITRNGDNKKES
jgi:two-component system LytT family response regulator